MRFAILMFGLIGPIGPIGPIVSALFARTFQGETTRSNIKHIYCTTENSNVPEYLYNDVSDRMIYESPLYEKVYMALANSINDISHFHIPYKTKKLSNIEGYDNRYPITFTSSQEDRETIDKLRKFNYQNNILQKLQNTDISIYEREKLAKQYEFDSCDRSPMVPDLCRGGLLDNWTNLSDYHPSQ